jgi:hypothetical protein
MSFQPSKYLSKSYFSNSKSKKTFTIKGKSSSSDTILEEEDLNKIISNLRDNEYVSIKKLSGSLKNDYDALNKYIGLTYQTNIYETLKKMIDSKFEDIETLTPGSIGAFFRGSSLKNNMEFPECGVLSAGSIPKEDDNWTQCKNSVILAVRNSHGYDFTLLRMGEDPSHSYVHVKHDSYEDFEGFNSDEKKKLKKYGIEYVYLHGYEDDPTKQKDLVGSAMGVDEIKGRKCNSCENSKDNTKEGSWLGIILLIVFIIIIIALIYMMM